MSLLSIVISFLGAFLHFHSLLHFLQRTRFQLVLKLYHHYYVMLFDWTYSVCVSVSVCVPVTYIFRKILLVAAVVVSIICQSIFFSPLYFTILISS